MNSRHVQPGQDMEIAATDHNRWQDTADAVLGKQGDKTPRPIPAPRENPTVFDAENTSGSDLDEGTAVGIVGPIFTHEDNPDEFLFATSLQIDDTPEAGHFGILLSPVAAGEIGTVAVAGIVPAQVRIDDDNHRFTEIDQAGILASTAHGSAELLWKAGTSGQQWALIRLGRTARIHFGAVATTGDKTETVDVTPDDARLVAAGSAVTVQIYAGAVESGNERTARFVAGDRVAFMEVAAPGDDPRYQLLHDTRDGIEVEVITAAQVVQTVIPGLNETTYTQQLQVKTRMIYVQRADEETEWADHGEPWEIIDTDDECSYAQLP